MIVAAEFNSHCGVALLIYFRISFDYQLNLLLFLRQILPLQIKRNFIR